MIGRTRIVTNTVYNVLGVAVPICTAIFTVPWYLHTIGEARYGILSLVWIVFGYFGLFDFGLSRATTNRLAQLRDGDPSERNSVFYTALLTNSVMGVVAGILFYTTLAAAFRQGLGGKAALVDEILDALPWLASFFPLALMGGVFVGSLEAEERFSVLTVQQILGTVLQQVLPLAAVLVFTPKVEFAVLGALTARAVSVIWNAAAALATIGKTGYPAPRLALVWSLLKYGANVTVTNLISPLLVSADQFVIATQLGTKSLAYYAVPFNMAMKATILPGALSRALFPRLSGLHGDAATALAERASVTLAGVLALFCAPAIVLANFGLTLWLGRRFAGEAAWVAELLLVGTWFNGIAYVPFSFLQSRGRPDITARFHALELLPFLAVLWLAVHFFGLPGAALAWCLRVAVDAALLYWASGVSWRHISALVPAGLSVLFAMAIVLVFRPPPLYACMVATVQFAGTSVWLLTHNPDLRRCFTALEKRLRIGGRFRATSWF